MTKHVLDIGSPVVVYDRGRPQAGRDVHPGLITQVIDDETVSVRVLPENGVDYPIKGLKHIASDNATDGLSWRFPGEETETKRVREPAPQDTRTPTPGLHEPRAVGGQAVAKPGEQPNKAVGEGSDNQNKQASVDKADAKTAQKAGQ